jgi:fused signal recognition particle receptor
MFGVLKKKLQEAIGSFSKKAEKEAEVVEDIKEVEEVVVLKEKHVSKPTKPDKKEEHKKEPVKKEEKSPAIKEKKPTTEAEEKKELKKEAHAEKKQKETDHRKEVEISHGKKAVHEIKEIKTAEQSLGDKKHHVPSHKIEDAIATPVVHEIKLETKPEIKPGIKEEKKEERKKEKRGFFDKLFKKKEPEKKSDVIIEKKNESQGEIKEVAEEKKIIDETEAEKPKNIFEHISDSISKVTLSDAKFEELFWDLELSLLENNVAVEVIEKIKSDLKVELTTKKLPRGGLDKKVFESLARSIEGLFDAKEIDLIQTVKEKKPYVIVIVGINGSGKTTTIGKLIHLFKKNNLDCVVGACDTFRAAAIQQLEAHTTKLEVKLIKQDYGSDPAAVAYDAVEHAKAKGKDVVLIDTAGRLHSNANLMAELEKVIRVVKPDMKIFVGESIAGNDVVEQVKLFNERVGIDAIILAKADVDDKGGAAISVSYVTGKPILYLGTGQGYDDLVEFSKEKIMEQIGL